MDQKVEYVTTLSDHDLGRHATFFIKNIGTAVPK